LDAEDKKKCIEALKQGFEEQFIFGLEAAVINPDLKKDVNNQDLMKSRLK
jgi:hypothetical protein